MTASYPRNEIEQAMDKDYNHPNHDYGEEQEWLGKIIPQLTDEQKKKVHWKVLNSRAAQPKASEETLRKDFAFAEVFGDEEVLKVDSKYFKGRS